MGPKVDPGEILSSTLAALSEVVPAAAYHMHVITCKMYLMSVQVCCQQAAGM